MIDLFVNIDEQKNQKRKCTSLFLKYLQIAFIKATQPLQCDTVPGQSEIIAKRCRFFYLQLFSNKYNNNCFFDLYWEYWPKFGRYLDLEHNSLNRSEEQLLLYYYETKFKLKYCWTTCKEKMQKWNQRKIHKDTNRWLLFIFSL